MIPEDMSCWWCGVAPDEVYEIRTWEGHVRSLPHWPTGDHAHSERPPTADDLLDQGLFRDVQ